MITTLSVNYNTPDFLERLIKSFRKFYDIPMLIVDGSDEDKFEQIRDFPEKYNIELHHFYYNIHHGPGMAYGIEFIKTKQILLLDSDLIVLKGGFIEDLQSKLRPESYGIGDVQIIDSRGYNANVGTHYLHPACALINREIALKYPMPILHGAPMIRAMETVDKSLLQHEAWVTNDFRNRNKIFVSHDWQGTVTRTGGYHLEN